MKQLLFCHQHYLCWHKGPVRIRLEQKAMLDLPFGEQRLLSLPGSQGRLTIEHPLGQQWLDLSQLPDQCRIGIRLHWQHLLPGRKPFNALVLQYQRLAL